MVQGLRASRKACRANLRFMLCQPAISRSWHLARLSLWLPYLAYASTIRWTSTGGLHGDLNASVIDFFREHLICDGEPR